MAPFDGHDGQAVAPIEQGQAVERPGGPHLAQGDRAGELFDELYIDHRPPRIVLGGFGVIIGRVPVPLGRIGVGFPHDPADAHTGRRGGVGVVEYGEIPPLHPAQKISGLVVPHPVPVIGSIRSPPEIVDGVDGGFGFDEPVVHDYPLRNDPKFFPIKFGRAKDARWTSAL